MKFNAQEHLDAYAEGRFPRIHDAIAEAALLELPPPTESGRVLDLLCSTGLLGARLRSKGYRVAFAEMDGDARTRGMAAGTYGDDPLWTDKISTFTMDRFLAWLQDHGVTLVVARRCLCELDKVIDLSKFGTALADIGVTQVVLEGQRGGKRPISPGIAQAEALAPSWRIVTTYPPQTYALELA